MRLFFAVLVAATIIGGFVGGEIADRAFTVTGAVVGGVGTAAVLLGLGAYFEAQERKKRDKALPPEIRAVFDRMMGQQSPRQTARTQRRSERPPTLHHQEKPPPLDLDSAVRDLIAQDVAAAARGEILPRRLIPHHAIKRDVAVAAYRRDFDVATEQLARMSWTEEERARRREEISRDFERQLARINRLGPEELDKLIGTMKRTRTDFAELEEQVRESNMTYRIVEPL